MPGSDFGAFACSVFPERFAARLASPLMGFAATPPNPLVGFAAKLARPLKGLAPELLELLLEVETFLKLKSPAGSFLFELELDLELEGRTFSFESSDLFLLGLFTIFLRLFVHL